MKTGENGKRMEKTQVPLQRIPDPQPRRGAVPRVFYWAIGLIVGGVVMAVAIGTVVVYRQRLETLQGRVDVLEQHYFDVETRMRTYVDERLRSLLLQQVSTCSLYHYSFCALNHLCCLQWRFYRCGMGWRHPKKPRAMHPSCTPNENMNFGKLT